jgi:hypothetical protein
MDEEELKEVSDGGVLGSGRKGLNYSGYVNGPCVSIDPNLIDLINRVGYEKVRSMNLKDMERALKKPVVKKKLLKRRPRRE